MELKLFFLVVVLAGATIAGSLVGTTKNGKHGWWQDLSAILILLISLAIGILTLVI